MHLSPILAVALAQCLPPPYQGSVFIPAPAPCAPIIIPAPPARQPQPQPPKKVDEPRPAPPKPLPPARPERVERPAVKGVETLPRPSVAPTEPTERRIWEGDAFPVDADKTWNFGVDRSRVRTDRQRYSFQGREISSAEAMRLIEEGIPDDVNRLRLTVIGPEPDRARVLADLDAPPLVGLKSLCVVQGYEPTNPIIQNLGFVTTGRPTIYLQRPDGTVLHRQDGYEGPARLAEALRRADPNYDPHRDPDLTRPKPRLGGDLDLSRVPLWAWGALAVGAYLFLSDNRRPEK